MSEGLNGWYGLAFLIMIVGFVAIAGGVFVAAAIRLMVRDDWFDDPDEYHQAAP